MFDRLSVLKIHLPCATINDPCKMWVKVHMQLSHVTRKPVYALCEQQRRRSACASAQSDQRLCCSIHAI